MYNSPRENPPDRRRRARARARLETSPEPARERAALRPGEPGDGPDLHARSHRGLGHRRARQLRPGQPDRPRRGRPRAAAHARDRRRAGAARDPRVRADRGGGDARVEQGLLQGVHAAPRHPDGGLRGLHRLGRRARLPREPRGPLPPRREGGRTCRRQGGRRLRGARAGPRGRARDHGRAGARRRGRAARDRGVPRGPRGLVLRALRRRRFRPPGHLPGLQAGARRRPRPQHRRHGLLLPERLRGRSDRPLRARTGRRSDAGRPCRRGAPLPRRALRRPHAHAPGAARARVQRPVRRSRDAGPDAPDRLGPRPPARGCGRGAPGSGGGRRGAPRARRPS